MLRLSVVPYTFKCLQWYHASWGQRSVCGTISVVVSPVVPCFLRSEAWNSSSLQIYLFFFFIYVLFAYVCVPYAWIAWKSQKQVLELELQIVHTCHVGLGNQTWVLWTSSPSSNHWANSLPLTFFLYLFSSSIPDTSLSLSLALGLSSKSWIQARMREWMTNPLGVLGINIADYRKELHWVIITTLWQMSY